jgi:DNA-binding transcriptional LysR family regulator
MTNIPTTNIPTDLLRTLVAVVDLRSFTKAAQSLGVTQPAVSAQIKRLQGMLGADLLDKSAPGVSLTSSGELVVNYARRLLSINDQILDIAGPKLAAQTIRIGATGDITAAAVASGIGQLRLSRPELQFQVYIDKMDTLLRDLREGETDLAIWASSTGPSQDTRYFWTEPMVWVRGASMEIDPARPVPLTSYGEDHLFGRIAMNVLSHASRGYEKVFTSLSLVALANVVAAGAAVMALPKSRANLPGLEIWENAPLPSLPDVFLGLYVRDGADMQEREKLAEALVAALNPPPMPENITRGQRTSAA